MGRRRLRTNREIASAIHEQHGNLRRAAHALGYTWNGFHSRLSLAPDLRRLAKALRVARRIEDRVEIFTREHELRWTDPRSPWMATIDVELEPIESGGIGSGWGRAPKRRAA